MTPNMWMRWLDFRRFRDLFWIVAEHDCALRAKDLNELAVKEGVLVNERGQPFKATPLYHYRRTLERLGLVRLDYGRYCIARDKPTVDVLLLQMRRGQPLSADERMSFATLVVRNEDCYEAFLRVFVDDDAQPSNVDDFVKQGKPVSVRIDPQAANGIQVALHNLDTGYGLSFSGASAIQAILWGVKPWCVEQLQFVDEVFSVGTGYVLYPRVIKAPSTVAVAHKLVELLEFKDEWAIVRVEELILKAGRRWRFPAHAVREALYWLRQQFPGHVATIPTSEQFVLGGIYPAQRKAVLNSYLRLPSAEVVSHLRIHSAIVKMPLEQGAIQ